MSTSWLAGPTKVPIGAAGKFPKGTAGKDRGEWDGIVMLGLAGVQELVEGAPRLVARIIPMLGDERELAGKCAALDL